MKKPFKENKRPVIVKKQPYGRIVKIAVINGREWQYHATKGWRNFRA